MTGLLALLDDVATTLDDVAVMTKVAMKKTSALMTDDLAVNAGVLEGAQAQRELPLVFKIFLGSLVNKVLALILILAIMAIYPPLINAMLLIGGLYLSYEGAHKIVEKLFHRNQGEQKKVSFDEKTRVFGAIKTDFILSIEILVIANSTLTDVNFMNRALTLSLVGLVASLLIYGLVAFIVKIDDFGLWLIKRDYKKIGMALVNCMPFLMKGLGFVGTVAMLLVGGGIIAHIFHLPYYTFEMIQNGLLGLIAGMLTLGVMIVGQKVFARKP